MNVSTLVPHPTKPKAIVVLQSAHLISNLQERKNHKLYDFPHDFSSKKTHDAYQILVKFFK